MILLIKLKVVNELSGEIMIASWKYQIEKTNEMLSPKNPTIHKNQVFFID